MIFHLVFITLNFFAVWKAGINLNNGGSGYSEEKGCRVIFGGFAAENYHKSVFSCIQIE
jgi:hypothetical protein